MCRIASLFLLQRLKGCVSGDARDFNKMETPSAIKIYFSCKAMCQRKFTQFRQKHLWEHTPSYATIKNWVAQFNVVFFPPVMRLVLDDAIHWPHLRILIKFTEQILEDRRISAKPIAEQLGNSRGRVGSIIREDLDKRELSE